MTTWHEKKKKKGLLDWTPGNMGSNISSEN